jgi:hypothetical protein
MHVSCIFIFFVRNMTKQICGPGIFCDHLVISIANEYYIDVDEFLNETSFDIAEEMAQIGWLTSEKSFRRMPSFRQLFEKSSQECFFFLCRL